MFLLPPELLQEIASYLTFKEISYCCLVCVYWRNALNIDNIWKRLAYERFGSNIFFDNLLDNTSKVHPKLNFPGYLTGQLSDLCHWRKFIIAENHVIGNWKTGRFTSEDIKNPLDNSNVNKKIKVCATCECKDIFVLYNVSNDFDSPVYTIKIWNTELSSETSHNISTIPKVKFSLFKLVNGLLVTVQGLLLQVFQRNNNNYNLKYINLINFEHEHHTSPRETDDLSQWYFSNSNKNILNKYVYQSDHNGKYFVALGSIKSIYIHIWNLNDFSRTKISLLNENNDSEYNNEFELLDYRLYITSLLKNTGSIRCFNLNKMEFYKWLITFPTNNFKPPQILLSEQFVVMNQSLEGKKIKLWDSNNGSLIRSIEYQGNLLNISRFGLLIYASVQFQTGLVKFFDINNIELSRFRVSHSFVKLSFIWHNVIIVWGIVSTAGFQPAYTYVDIWDISKPEGKKISSFTTDDADISINPSKSKLLYNKFGAANNEVSIVHFW